MCGGKGLPQLRQGRIKCFYLGDSIGEDLLGGDWRFPAQCERGAQRFLWHITTIRVPVLAALCAQHHIHLAGLGLASGRRVDAAREPSALHQREPRLGVVRSSANIRSTLATKR